METDTRRLTLVSVILGIAAVTLLPVKTGFGAAFRSGMQGAATGAPFLENIRYINVLDVAQNLVLFIPFGILFVADPGRTRSPVRRALVASLAGLFLSAVVETLQCGIPGRFPSLCDIAFNGLGSLLGALAAFRMENRAGTKSL